MEVLSTEKYLKHPTSAQIAAGRGVRVAIIAVGPLKRAPKEVIASCDWVSTYNRGLCIEQRQ